jgi:hypothetical protein
MQPMMGRLQMLEQKHNTDFRRYTHRWSRNKKLVVAMFFNQIATISIVAM